MRIWQEILSTAIVGTERQKPDFSPDFSSAESNELRQILSALKADDAESSLLQTAAVCAVWRAAGKKFAIDKSGLPSVAAPETRSYIGDKAGRILDLLLEQADNALLLEFLELAHAHNQIIKPRFVPRLLQIADADDETRLKSLAVVGTRGRWLAGQNAAWNWVLIDEKIDEIWQTGALPERRFALRRRRLQNPDEAREMLAATWKTEAAKERAAFIEILRVNMSKFDEPFLNEVLADDKSRDVRGKTFELLLFLPDSKMIGRLTELAARFLILEYDAKNQPIIEVVFSEDLVKIEKDFLVDYHYLFFESEFGKKGASVVKLLACVPPIFWENHFSLDRQTLINASVRGEWSKVLLNGFKFAALNFADVQWLINVLPVNGQNEYKSIIQLIKLRWTNQQIEHLIVRLLNGELKNGMSGTFIELLLRILNNGRTVDLTRHFIQFLLQNQSDKPDFDLTQFNALASFLLQSAHLWAVESITENEVVKINQAFETTGLASDFLAILNLRRKMIKSFQSEG